MGAPVSQLSQATPSNRSVDDRAKTPDIGCWPMCRTLMAKCSARRNRSRFDELRARQNRIRGGSSDTEEKELAVSPTGRPCSSRVVTTVTPVAKQPRASRRVRASDPA